MKVTKLIREYVEDEVAKVYDVKVNPYSEQAKLDRQKIEELKKELVRQQIETITKFTSENELYERGWSTNLMRPYKVSTCIPGFNYCCTQAMVDEEEWKNENTRLKREKVREIIVNLELGATKQELNEMIVKLMEEQK